MAEPGFVFTLTPVTGQPDLPLDLGTREGQNVHPEVTKEFTEKFGGEADNEMTFVSNVSERVTSTDWDRTTISMIDIPIGVPFITEVIECIMEYGRVTMANIRNHALNYVGTPMRVSQNLYHMYEALMASITLELHKRILVDLDQAKINNVGNRTMLFKLILSECTINTPAIIIRIGGGRFLQQTFSNGQEDLALNAMVVKQALQLKDNCLKLSKQLMEKI